ncbi:MAG: hypothetical protein ASARMPRED_007958 [Alectoria sarmentosa]|nr:MAG: hypothetical protein ASARMPRED_007958 [Alectoria sarmentosa]
MSSLVSGAVTGLITGISGLVSGNANDQNFRNGWTQQNLGTVTAANPKKNVIIVFPPHDQNLQGSKYLQLVCKTPTQTLSYDCYIFDSGDFTLKGDGGYLNWAFSATATHNAADNSSIQTSTRETQGRLFTGDRIAEGSLQSVPASLTFSGRLVRASKSQPAGLWNPVNSSAIVTSPSIAALSDVTTVSSLAGHPPQLALTTNPSNTKTALLQRNNLQSQSSAQVKPPGSGRILSPRSNTTRSPQGGLRFHFQPSSLPKRLNHAHSAMTSTPSQQSLHSDSPSRRPPAPAKDLEYGILHPPPQKSQASSPRASLQASSNKSNLAWGPSHPCYPHPNPHVPLTSPLRSTTRIIRIPRDWMIEGDLAPTFSHTYPEVLDPWISEPDFRTLINSVNEGLITAFSPYGWRAWVDALLGVATGWIYEDLGFAGVKKGARDVELLIEEWNGQRRKGLDKEDEELVMTIPLRRTGYLCLDIQIPDPHVGAVEDEGEGEGEETADGSAAGSIRE